MDFIHNSLQLIEQYMLAYGYWAVFFGVMLENAGLPVPGETILLVGGYFASTHPDQFNLIRVMATAAYEHDDDAAPRPQATARVFGEASGSRRIISR